MEPIDPNLPETLQNLPHHLAERARPINANPIDPHGELVLCWLHHAIRDTENPALDTAIHLAAELDKPLLVYQGLAGNHAYNTARSHTFILEGAKELAERLADRGIAYAFHLPKDPASPSPLAQLARRACCTITEDFPAPPMPRWTKRLAEHTSTALIAIDTACLAPMRLINKQHTRAFKFRDAAKKAWRSRIREPWPVDLSTPKPFDTTPDNLGFQPTTLGTASIEQLVANCDIDHTVKPVVHTKGGMTAATERWHTFRDRRLRAYHKRRNDPLDADAVSRLSPYLHHGHISPFLVAREANEINGGGPEKFLDELLVWRELAHNFCFHTANDSGDAALDSIKSIPDWAVETLRDAADDKRQTLSLATLAAAETGDELWDAAQQSLITNGELHNNLRMTWGKAVLRWTHSPEDALAAIIELNHRFALDGCDPNSYGGLLWCLGQFDRPFEPPQPVFGRVRARDTETHAERLDPARFRAAIQARASEAGLFQ